MLTREAVLGRLRGNLEPVTVAVLAAAAFLLPGNVIGSWHAIPVGILLLALAQGSVLSLHAIGVILVHRSNRIINFAQGALGGVATYLFYNVVSHRELISLLARAGVPVGTDVLAAPYWLQVLNFLVALLVGLIAGPLVGFLGYTLVIRWFRRVPPLTVTVASIGLAALVGAALTQLRGFAIFPDDHDPFQLPFDVVVSVDQVDVHLVQLAAMVIAVLVAGGLAVFFRRSAVGLSLRAASGNSDRASTLGVPVTNVVSVAWVMAGMLSALAGMLTASTSTSDAVAGGFPADVLVRVLAVAVIARFTSIPVALIGAVGLSVVEQSLQWNVGNSDVFDALLVVLITIFLLLRSERRQRADVAEETFAVATVARPTPAILRRHPAVQRSALTGGVLLGLVVLGYPWVVAPGLVDGATVVMIDAMVGLSLLVLTGWAGQVSLGHFALAGMGGFAAAFLGGAHGVPMPVALVLGGLAGAVVATLIGIPALRLPGLNLAVVTLALAVATSAVILNPTYLGRVLPSDLQRPAILGLNSQDVRVFYYLILVLLAGVAVVVVGLRRSRLARSLIAARDNPQAAQSFGVNLTTSRLIAFAVSGFIAAFAGGLLAYQQYGVRPQSFGADVSTQQLLVTLIGGLGSVLGPPLAAVVFFLLPQLDIPIVAQLGVPLASLLLLLLYPAGFGGLAFALRDSALRRIAVRHRVDVPSLFQGRGLDRRHARAPLAPRSRARAALGDVPRYRITQQWSAGRAPAAEAVHEA